MSSRSWVFLGLLVLGACAQSPQWVQVACKIDAGLQPIAVPVAVSLGVLPPNLAEVDQLKVHPVVVAACQALGGTVDKVTVE